MNIILFDSHIARQNLLPFTFTRPIADIRVGITTIREKWQRYFGLIDQTLTEQYLSEKFPYSTLPGESLFINGAVFPDLDLVNAITKLETGQALFSGELCLAAKAANEEVNYKDLDIIVRKFKNVTYKGNIQSLRFPWDIFLRNSHALQDDYTAITKGRKSQTISSTNTIIGERTNIFLEEGAVMEGCIINTNSGPVYIGKDAEIMEGGTVRGSVALCEHAVLKMGAKVYGATTLGPYCKAGGELNNVVFMGYANKAHDGFLGNSVIGEWCNLGADTNNSNLKNNYSPVKVFNYTQSKEIDTGLQFCGLFMGDHSKCGINTMFNTATVVGVSCNVFGADFPPKFIPSFSWGGAAWLRTYSFEKSLEAANRMMERRGMQLDDADLHILKEIFAADEKFRKKYSEK